MLTRVEPSSDMTRAEEPPIVKAVGLLRFVPVIVTSVPTDPLAGENDVIVGACAIDTRLSEKKARIRIICCFINLILSLKDK